jgi:hypothetical protein
MLLPHLLVHREYFVPSHDIVSHSKIRKTHRGPETPSFRHAFNDRADERKEGALHGLAERVLAGVAAAG